MRLAVAAAALCTLAPYTGAQQTSGRITGVVRAAADSSTLSQVRVSVRGTELSAATNGSGAFVLDRVPLGRLVIEVRRLGFRAVDSAMTIRADTSLVVWLASVPRRLAEIEVHGKRIMIPAHMREIYERADRNHGALITADDIEKAFPQSTESMLQGIAGIHVETRKIEFVRCSNPRSAPSAFRGSPPKVHVYVNGSRHSVTGDPYEVREIIRSIHPNDVELIEIYGGVTRIPAEFLVDACAVVAIWTKAY